MVKFCIISRLGFQPTEILKTLKFTNRNVLVSCYMSVTFMIFQVILPLLLSWWYHLDLAFIASIHLPDLWTWPPPSQLYQVRIWPLLLFSVLNNKIKLVIAIVHWSLEQFDTRSQVWGTQSGSHSQLMIYCPFCWPLPKR